MEDLVIGFTQEERKRFRKYTDLIIGSKGRFDILSKDEQKDLQVLLEKTMKMQSDLIEAE